jgi:hypothetical protein
MKIKTSECAHCPYLILDEIMEDYICAVDKNALTKYVGDTKWEIEGSDVIRNCPMDV